MSIQVKSIDVYGIEERLRKDQTKEGKETWNYVKKLKEALERQQKLTAEAISKLRTPISEKDLDNMPSTSEMMDGDY